MELSPKQRKKLERIQKLIKQGDAAILEYLFEIEEKIENEIPSLKEIIAKIKGDKGDSYVITDDDKEEIKENVLSLVDLESIKQKVIDSIDLSKLKGKNGDNYVITDKDRKQISEGIKSACIDFVTKKIESDIKTVKELVDYKYALTKSEIQSFFDSRIPTADSVAKLVAGSGEIIRDSLELLNGDDRLDYKAIKGLENYSELWDLVRQKGGSYSGVLGVQQLVAGTNISIDNTNPHYPIISSTGGGGGSQSLQEVTDIGATTTVESTFSGGIVTPNIKASSSAGTLLEANNGTDIGLFGAGNTANVTWYGSHNYNALSANTIPYLGASKTLSSNSSRLTINPTLWYFGFGVATPTAVGHFAQTTNETATAPTSVTATAVLQTRDSAPTSSNIISTVYQTDVPQGLSISSTTQNTGSGNYIANGQTINYSVWAYKDVPDGASTTRVYTIAATGSFTDTINDSTTPFTVSVSWSIASGIADGYIIYSDNAGSSPYTNDVGTDTSAEDDGVGFTTGSGSSAPTGSFLLVSTGGTRNIRARAYVTPIVGSTQYYTDAYDYTVTEPTSGENYVIYHEVLSMGSYSGVIQIYGANDGSVTYTGSYQFSSGSLLETESFWGSGGVTQTPTDWTNITGAGQVLKYKARTRVISGGFGYYYSSNESNEASVTVPNTGSKYYIQISGVAGTSTTPAFAPSNFGYRIYKAAPTSYTETTTQTPTVPIQALAAYDTGTNFSAGTEATPTSWIGSAAIYSSQGFGDPLATGVNYSLQAIFKSTSSSSATCGFEFRDSTDSRMAAIFATSGILNIATLNSILFKNTTGTQYASFSGTSLSFGSVSGSIPMVFNGSATIPNLLYVNPSTSKVVVGSTTSSGFFGIVGHSSLSVPIMHLQHAGSGKAFVMATSSGVEKFGIDGSGNVRLQAGLAFNYVAKSSTYTVVQTDGIIDCTSSTFTVTLLGATTVPAGTMFVIKNSGTGIITIATTSSQTIDGATTLILGVQYQSVTLISDGSNWKTI